MSVTEIVDEASKLSPDELRQVARALREGMEDAEDLADAIKISKNPGRIYTLEEVEKATGL